MVNDECGKLSQAIKNTNFYSHLISCFYQILYVLFIRHYPRHYLSVIFKQLLQLNYPNLKLRNQGLVGLNFSVYHS